MRYDPSLRFWYLVDWGLYNLNIDIATDEEITDLIQLIITSDAHALKVVRKHQTSQVPRSIVFYCVSAAKHLVGSLSWAVTPRQLYCALLKDGAEPIFVKTE